MLTARDCDDDDNQQNPRQRCEQPVGQQAIVQCARRC
jgi:hypothetical protein